MLGTIKRPTLYDAFPSSYELAVLAERPGDDSMPTHGSGWGPVLRITPTNGSPFRFIVPGSLSKLALTTMPHPDWLGVLPHDAAPLFVNVLSPQKPLEPAEFDGHYVRGAIASRKAGVLILRCCCDVIAYGRGGRLWSRSDLYCCDEYAHVDVADNTVLVTGESHGDVRRKYRLDVYTGMDV